MNDCTIARNRGLRWPCRTKATPQRPIRVVAISLEDTVDLEEERMMIVYAENVSREELLERELWLLAMCWKAGWKLRWETVQHWLEGLVRTCPIRARA